MVLRSVSLATYLLPVGLTAFGGAFVLDYVGERRWSNRSLAGGWVLLAGFWLAVASTRLDQERLFLGTTALLAAATFGYVATLSVRDRWSSRRLSWAFLVMGALYTPFQLVEPVHRRVVELVTTTTSLGLDSLGYVSLVSLGASGNQNVILVTGPSGEDPVTMSILSACTGISAMALFAGLIAAADCSRRRRLKGILVVTSTVFFLNIVRNVFTIVAYREHSFAFLSEMELPLVTIANSPQQSYVIAEQVVAPVYIVVGTVIVYTLLTARYPTVDPMVRDVVRALAADYHRARTLLASRR